MLARTRTRSRTRSFSPRKQRELFTLPDLPVASRDWGPPPGPGDTIAGYRLVRKLAAGGRAVVFLGVPDGDLPTGESGGPGSPVALKVYRPQLERADADAEISALARLDDPHLVRLLDVGGSDLPVAVLERVSRSSLTALLVERTRLSSGEAVTVLAPLVGAVGEMHRSGVVHGSIGVPRVLFRDSGAPVLAGFGHSRLLDGAVSAAALSADPGVLADRRALGQVVQTVLQRVQGSALDGVRDWFDGAAAATEDNWCEALQELLFTASAGEPIAFSETRITPAVLVGQGASTPVPGRIPGLGRADAASASHAGRATPRSVAAVVGLARSGLLLRLRTQLGSVRRPVWIVAAAVAVALVVAGFLVPTNGSPTNGGPTSRGAANYSVTPDPSPGDSRPSSTAIGEETAEDTAIAGDDAIAATSALLTAREHCFRELSILCLDGVDQVGSAALESDTGLVRAIQDGAELADAAVFETGEITIVEELGDSVLVDLGRGDQNREERGGDSKPASLLIMRGEAGWRIRDYLEE